jgi:glycosyltransferase involved in cell wall biosynthesis
VRRILLLNTDLEIGGTPTVIRELSIRLRDAGGTHIEVACLGRWGPVADQIAAAQIPVTALNARSAIDFSILPRLIRLIRDHQIDTVLSFLVHANAIAAAASQFLRNVRFLQSIQTTQRTPRWHWAVQALAQSAAERIVVPSASVADVAKNWARVPAEKIIVIPNAVDLAERAADSREIHSPPTIGFVGRLDPVKHIPDLIHAMRFLDGAQLHIFGQGRERAALEQLIGEFHLQDRVLLRGPTNGPREALEQIDVLVLPSEAEGFGLVLIEAMAAGVPVVATDAPGIRDVVRRNHNGLLIPIGIPRAIAGAVELLLRDASRRARLIANGRDDVRRRFTWESILPQYIKLLNLP